MTPPNSRDRIQLTLDLPSEPPDYRRDHFIVTHPDNNPLATIDAWLASDETRLVICGPAGSGKTHLATIIADALKTDIAAVSADGAFKVGEDQHAYIIDELETLTSPKRLVEVIEQARFQNARIVLVGAGAPADWTRGLRDLATRLEAMPRIELDEPDEELMRKVLTKLFADRQAHVPEAVVNYAAPRLPRTFAAARNFVAAADAAGLEDRSPITRNLAKKVIANLSVASSDT